MTAVADPFEHTATGLLGDKRDTMLGNQLLLRVIFTLLEFKSKLIKNFTLM